MYIPLQYQVSEYDCVPTSFINAVSYLFQRNEIPPMVVRHIYMYSLDTVGKDGRFGSAGTSRHAVRLLGSWLNAYKSKQFSVKTEFIMGEKVHLKKNGKIQACLKNGGVCLCQIFLTRKEEHYLLLLKAHDGWLFCFDPYYRKTIRGLGDKVQVIKTDDTRSPNLKIRIQWLEQESAGVRFCLGPLETREGLLIWRNPRT